MPSSLVIHLKVISDCKGEELHGGVVQLGILKILHKIIESNIPKEKLLKNYTISSLYLGERSPRVLSVDIEAGTVCWFRIACLDEKYLEPSLNKLYQEIITKQINFIEAGSLKLEILRAICQTSSRHPWVDSITIEDLYKNASKEEKESLLDFASPTIFPNSNLWLPLPIPDFIYTDLAEKWNFSAPDEYRVKDNILDFLKKHISLVSFKELSTNVLPVAGGKRRIGFVGKVRFRLIGTEDLEIIHCFNMLSDVVFYSSLGSDTTMGCGMARRIPRAKWELLRQGINH